MTSPQILIVDNEERFCKVVQAALEMEGLSARYCTSGKAALQFLQHHPVQIVVSDLRMDEMDGLQLLDRIKRNDPETEVVIMTAYATQKTAVEALKKGAHDYLIKPFEMDELVLRLRRILEQKQLRASHRRMPSEPPTPIALPGMVGKSKKMQDLFRLIRKAAETDVTVLILGESGTGKELVAQAIHHQSARSGKAFVTVNCAALPETLLESELFGYEKGAFTGATQRRAGKFEQANGGTIFLDEIGDMSLATQAKLLRVLQNKEVYRLGGSERLIVDTRIIAATHQDLEGMVAAGRFREDLFYRLNVFPISVPSLRERKEDIPELVHFFLQQTGARGISRQALSCLMEYHWPGNVRELRNVIERAAILCDGVIEEKDLPAGVRRAAGTYRPLELPDEGIVLDDLERELILQALEKCGGNKTRAAELLGITRRRLYSLMERFGIRG